MFSFSVSDWQAWSPGLVEAQQWEQWASEGYDLPSGDVRPALSHLSPLSRRRLSLISRMVLEVGHGILERNEDPMPVFFGSRYGEIHNQFKLSSQVITQGSVRPALFSHSVFNTPVSLLSIHENVQDGMTVFLSDKQCIFNGLISALSWMKENPGRSVLLLFSDEEHPIEYEGLPGYSCQSFAFGLILSPGSDFSLKVCSRKDSGSPELWPPALLRWILSGDRQALILHKGGDQVYQLARG